MLTDPDLIEQVLVTDADEFVRGSVVERVFGDLETDSLAVVGGEDWRRQRNLAQPAFAPERISTYAETMAEFAGDLADDWGDGREVDVRESMSRLALRILAKALLDLDLRESDEADRIRDAAAALVEKADYSSPNAYVPDWIPTPANRRFDRRTDDLHDLVDDLIDRRRADPGEDLLSTLIQASEDGDGLSESELRDNVVGFLLAGHETTAVALTYAWYALSRNPQVRERLHGEVDDLDGPPSPREALDLSYTERVMRETLRLYPPTFGMVREPLRDVDVGGYRIAAGETLFLPQWAVHRDGRFYAHPHEFRPDRWTEDRNRPEYAYFPFGGGPHHCIGMRFARMEFRIVLATLARRIHLDVVDESPLEFSASLTLRPKRPIEARVRRRE
jgi:cytochrome P450